MRRTTSVDTRVGHGHCFGTFGELIQGALPPDGRDFLVTVPVARWSHARFVPEPGWPIRVRPGGKSKSRLLVERMLRGHGWDGGGVLTITSTLPVGKGMASSSADLVASARAVANAFGLTLRPSEIEDALRGIEPSDGVMYDAAVAFCHREVTLLHELGALPALTIVGMDEGGTVDTVAFNQMPKAYTAAQTQEYAAMLAAAGRAVRDGDARTLGRLATRSAEMNQRLQPKRLLRPAMELSARMDALGVLAAHSGTRLGILLADADPDYDRKLAHLSAACGQLTDSVHVEYTLR
ncbi:GHMP family kinase ATP-binding protein [Nonomuraea indica]|uniref:GHMP kinase N-terminal domain-containing protein n=1 Tax=Nonomuraea indica TaxID=1581193 RepID=A0ABW8ADX7_9ACTN